MDLHHSSTKKDWNFLTFPAKFESDHRSPTKCMAKNFIAVRACSRNSRDLVSRKITNFGHFCRFPGKERSGIP